MKNQIFAGLRKLRLVQLTGPLSEKIKNDVLPSYNNAGLK